MRSRRSPDLARPSTHSKAGRFVGCALAVVLIFGSASPALADDTQAAGDAATEALIETAAEPVVVTAQPADLVVDEGGDATLSVSASNAETFQWQKLTLGADSADDDAWNDLDAAENASATTATLTLPGVDNSAQGAYRVAITGADGAALYSESAELTVTPDDEVLSEDPPAESAEQPLADSSAGISAEPAAELFALAELTVTRQPENISSASGASVRLIAESGGGVAPVTVQWQRSVQLSGSTAPTGAWVDIDRATSSTFTFSTGAAPHVTNRWYRAVFTDADGASVTTNSVKLTIVPAPVITENPSGQTVKIGESATFTAAADNAESVKWQSTQTILANGDPDDGTWADVPGGTASTLTVADVRASAHDTYYRAVFTNVSGERITQPAQLRVVERLDTSTGVEVTGESYGPTGTSPQSFSVKAPNAVVWGEDIVIEGFNYLAVDGSRGSIANALVDADYSGDPRTLSTTRTVFNPQTGGVYADKRGHNVVQAGGVGSANVGAQTVIGPNGQATLQTYSEWAPGYFRVVIPWPDHTNTDKSEAFFAENWAPGTQHTVRFLTGTVLQPGSSDYQRGISVRFTIVEEATQSAIAPAITTQPSGVSTTAGETAHFTATASGLPAPTVQWQSRVAGGAWVPIPGATSETLSLVNVASSQSGTQYRAVFTNAAGSATSGPAMLTVAASEVGVKTHPQDQSVETGERVVFAAEPAGAEISTQWERSRDGENWEIIRGAVHTTFAIEATVSDDADWLYRARFTNPGNLEGVTTDAASLNLSGRENVREYCGLSYGPSDHEGKRFCFTGPEKIVVGQDIVISGTGGYWATDGATGSVVNFFFDALYSGDPNTLYVKQPVTNPVTGRTVDDRRSHAVVQASRNGTWTVTIPWPTVSTVSPAQDGSTSFTQAQLDARFAPGTVHAVRMLTGSLLSDPADVQRGATLLFTVVGDLDDPVPVTEPIYQHETYRSTTSGDRAVAWLPTNADSGSDVPLTGTGWLTKDREAGSVVEIRLKDQTGAYYQRTGAAADPADPSLWQRVYVRSDGVLNTQIELPEGVTAGSYVNVELTTHDDGTSLGDVARTWESKALTVDGTPWAPPVTEGCVANPSAATFELAPGMAVPAANVGGTIRLTGENWCNTVTGEGSYIAIKINDGAYSHKGSASAKVFNAELGRETGLCQAGICTSNKTIWYVIEAAADGSFDVEIPLPNRTNTTPAFGEGSYTFRIMTGTLAGDPFYGGVREASRTVESPEFTVVAEGQSLDNVRPGKPTAPPTPLHAREDLTDAVRGGVTVTKGASAWTISVPKAQPGDWVYVNIYQGDSPRFPWSTQWFEVGANGRVTVPLAGITLPVGTNKLSVQDRNGNALGWTYVTVDEPAEEPAARPVTSRPTTQVRFAAVQMLTGAPKPQTAPDAPVATYDDLDERNVGDVTATEDDGVLTVTVPGIEGGDWVYLYLYTQTGQVVPVDWVQVGTDHTFEVDISALPDGIHKLAILDMEGELVGWVTANGPNPLPDEVTEEAEAGVGVTNDEIELAAPLIAVDDDTTWTLILVGLAVLVLMGSAAAVIVLRSPSRVAS